jgi:hypothetical protein
MYRPPPSSLTFSPRVFLPHPSRSSGPAYSQWLVVAAGGLVCEFLSLLASPIHRCVGSPDCGGGGCICVSDPWPVQPMVAHV